MGALGDGEQHQTADTFGPVFAVYLQRQNRMASALNIWNPNDIHL